MRYFKNADEYYDAVFERRRQNTAWRISLRYLYSVVTFLIFMSVALVGYWSWRDYLDSGYQAVSWDSIREHASFRIEELKQGRIGLD
jgi:hypothetical protein